jgi:hypothetical protein
MSQLRAGYVTVTNASQTVEGEWKLDLASTPSPGYQQGEPLTFTGGGATGVVTFWDADNQNLYYVLLTGTPLITDTADGVTSGASSAINAITATVDFTVDVPESGTAQTLIAAGDFFSVTQSDNPESHIDYSVGGSITAQSFDLAANYVGATQYHQTYVVHTSFTADLGEPVPEPGDGAIIMLMRAAAKVRNLVFRNVVGLGLDGQVTVPNALKSARVNAGGTALETKILMPQDASLGFTAHPTNDGTPADQVEAIPDAEYVSGKLWKAYRGLPLSGAEMTKFGDGQSPVVALTLGERILVSGTVSSASASTMVDTAKAGLWSDDEFNGLQVRYLDGNGDVVETTTIDDTVGATGTLNVVPNWVTPPSATDVYEILDDLEDREAARLQDVDDHIINTNAALAAQALALTRFTTRAELADDHDILADTLTVINQLGNLPINGADGVRHFELEGTLVLRGLGDTKPVIGVRVYCGPNGDVTDNLVATFIAPRIEADASRYATLSIGNGLDFTYDDPGSPGTEIPPAASDRLTVAILSAAQSIRVFGKLNTQDPSYVRVRSGIALRELIERTS